MKYCVSRSSILDFSTNKGYPFLFLEKNTLTWIHNRYVACICVRESSRFSCRCKSWFDPRLIFLEVALIRILQQGPMIFFVMVHLDFFWILCLLFSWFDPESIIKPHNFFCENVFGLGFVLILLDNKRWFDQKYISIATWFQMNLCQKILLMFLEKLVRSGINGVGPNDFFCDCVFGFLSDMREENVILNAQQMACIWMCQKILNSLGCANLVWSTSDFLGKVGWYSWKSWFDPESREYGPKYRMMTAPLSKCQKLRKLWRSGTISWWSRCTKDIIFRR